MHGDPVLLPGEPSSACTEAARELFDRVKTGEVRALAIVMHHRDGRVSHVLAGPHNEWANCRMLGALDRVKHAIHACMDDA